MATQLTPGHEHAALTDTQRLLDAAHALAAARDLPAVTAAVRHAARLLTGADGATFVQREGDLVHYVDEEAIGPLWKGCRFPASACISGWAMIHRETVAIEDILLDPRIPQDLYRPTFVRSLLMVPVGAGEPVAAIGAYWSHPHLATPRERALLESLAGFASLALRNAALVGELEGAVSARDRLLSVAAHELRTPLTPLSLQAELLLRGLAEHRSAESLRETAERIRANVRRATELVADLLDADRLSRGPAGTALEAVDLSALAREVALAVEQAEPYEVSTPVLAAAAPPVIASADPRRLKLAVESLVGQVARLARGRAVALQADLDGPSARLTITGAAGLAEAPAQADAAPPPGDRHHGGLELGLWAVRQLVEAQGGTVDLATGVGRAPAFTIRMPRFLEAPRTGGSPA